MPRSPRMSCRTARRRMRTPFRTPTSIRAPSEGDDMTTEKTAEKSQEYRPLTREELNDLAGEELPERAAMSLINANVAIPVNLAVAANVLSDGAVAYANAEQDAG